MREVMSLFSAVCCELLGARKNGRLALGEVPIVPMGTYRVAALISADNAGMGVVGELPGELPGELSMTSLWFDCCRFLLELCELCARAANAVFSNSKKRKRVARESRGESRS